MAAIPVAIFSSEIGGLDGFETRLCYQDSSNTGLKLSVNLDRYYEGDDDPWEELQKLDPEASEGNLMEVLKWSTEKIILTDGDFIIEIPATSANRSSLRQALIDLRTQYPEPFSGCLSCHGYRSWLMQRYQIDLESCAERDCKYLPDRREWLALSFEEQEKYELIAARQCTHAAGRRRMNEIYCMYCDGYRSYKKEKRAAGQSALEIQQSWYGDVGARSEYKQQDISTCPHTYVHLAKKGEAVPTPS